jgi:hypothetical protein
MCPARPHQNDFSALVEPDAMSTLALLAPDGSTATGPDAPVMAYPPSLVCTSQHVAGPGQVLAGRASGLGGRACLDSRARHLRQGGACWRGSAPSCLSRFIAANAAFCPADTAIAVPRAASAAWRS